MAYVPCAVGGLLYQLRQTLLRDGPLGRIHIMTVFWKGRTLRRGVTKLWVWLINERSSLLGSRCRSTRLSLCDWEKSYGLLGYDEVEIFGRAISDNTLVALSAAWSGDSRY